MHLETGESRVALFWFGLSLR